MIIMCGLFTCFCAFGIGTDQGKNKPTDIGGTLFVIFAFITLFFIMIV